MELVPMYTTRERERKRGIERESERAPYSWLYIVVGFSRSRTLIAHQLTGKLLYIRYEVNLFPWEMITKTVTSCFLNVEKNRKLGTNKLKLHFLLKIFFRHNNIHRKIDQWNRRRFGAKWHVTVPNSVTPIKHIVCKWIHMSQGWYCQITHKLHVY